MKKEGDVYQVSFPTSVSFGASTDDDDDDERLERRSGISIYDNLFVML